MEVVDEIDVSAEVVVNASIGKGGAVECVIGTDVTANWSWADSMLLSISLN